MIHKYPLHLCIVAMTGTDLERHMACGMAKRDMPWTITGLGSSNDPATGTGHMCLYENKAHPKVPMVVKVS
jgi:hypothetical protein